MGTGSQLINEMSWISLLQPVVLISDGRMVASFLCDNVTLNGGMELSPLDFSEVSNFASFYVTAHLIMW